MSAADPGPTSRRFVVVPAAYVYLLRPGSGGDEVLLQERCNTGYMDGHWAAAAGHVERGETAWDAARRELDEELGVEADDLRFVTTMQRTRGADPIDERVDFFFTCRAWRGRPHAREPHKVSRLGWFPLDRLPDRTVPHERTVLDGIRAGFLPPYITEGFADDTGGRR